jgi:hypothetical protein
VNPDVARIREVDMRRFAPLLTLLAVAVLGGALLTLNVVNSPANSTGTPSAAAASQPAVAAAPPPRLRPLPAPPAAPAVAEKAYAGRSAGNEVTVAIAVKDGRAVGYVCDGKKIEAWLEGTLSGSDLALKSKDGKSTIAATADDKQSFGTVAVSGKEWPFAAKAASSPAGCTRAAPRCAACSTGSAGSGCRTGRRRGCGTAGPTRWRRRSSTRPPRRRRGRRVPVTVRTIGGDDAVIVR